jgi:hypothetical protein
MTQTRTRVTILKPDGTTWKTIENASHWVFKEGHFIVTYESDGTSHEVWTSLPAVVEKPSPKPNASTL